MPRFGWTRLAYLLFVLTVLMVLNRPVSPGAETRSLAAEFPRGKTSIDARPSDATEPPASTQMRQWIEGAASSLVDLSGAGGTPQARSTGPEAPLPSPETAPSEDPTTTPPVFYRPQAARHSFEAPGLVCGDLGWVPASRRVVFPLEGRYFYSYEDTWGAPRTQGGHEGTDLMAPKGAPEYAVTDGTVVPVAGSNANGWNTLGGYAVMVRADYSIGPVKAGDLFYYAHLVRPSPLKVGTRVRAGQVVGYAGDTGQGPEVTRGLFPAHLHFGWYGATGGRSEVDSGAMNPYPLLEWIKASGGAVTGGTGARYCEAPSPILTTGERGWPAPEAPGVSPDLDTNSSDPKPSPVARNEDPTRSAPIRRAAPAKRAAPERPARALQDRIPQSDPRSTPELAPKAERFNSPNPPVPETPEIESPAAEPPKPATPRREPSGSEVPKPSAPEGGVPPSREPPPPGPVGERDPSVAWAVVTPLQELPLQDLMEGLIPDLDREPNDTENHDRPDEDRREQMHERGRDQQPSHQDHEEKPAANEPERSPNLTAGHDPAEDDPLLPNHETEDPDEPQPETTEPILEATVEPETTVE